MADVFISYSRRDEPFVERLREALAGSDKDVWVDREDIGPAVVWRREIELGIEGADVFAFVISPDSLRSEPCRREREYAQARNKRIVPLLRREPDGIAVPEELASRNYIYFRTDEEFAPGVASVLAAIDDLPEWAREHTRLLERAEEWEHSGQDPSFLLRGSDLSEAEAWLSSQGEHKEPRPTPLQTEYLLAGRKAATRRQRRTIAAVALALAVSVVLGGVALLQRDEAQEQRDEAIRQAQLAESRELAATSVAAVRTEPWEALELAVSAQETSATPEATEALRSALEAHRESAVLALPDDDVITSARFAGDSAHVLTSGFDRRVRRWDLATGEHEIVGMRPPYVWTQGRAALTTASGLRVTARPAGVRVTEAATGAVLIELDQLGLGIEGTIPAADVSPDGSSILTVGYDGTARVWPLRLRALPAKRVVAAAISPDGERCLTTNLDGVTTMWSCATGEELWSRQLRAPVESRAFISAEESTVRDAQAEFSADGSQVVVWTGSDTFIVDAASGDERSRFPRSLGRGSSPSVSPSGSLGLRALSRRHAELVELPEESRIRTVAAYFPFGGYRVAYSDDDRRVAISADPEPIVRVYDLETTDELPPIGPFEGPILAADLSGDGSLVVTATGTEAQLWNASTGARVGAVPAESLVVTAAFAADDRFLVTGEIEGNIGVWEASTQRRVAATRLIRGWKRRGSARVGGSSSWARRGSALALDCAACHPAPELLAQARAEIEARPASLDSTPVPVTPAD